MSTTGSADDLRWILTGRRARVVPRWGRAGARAFTVRARYRGLSKDDLLLAGFPKAGSTWMRFVLLELFMGESPSTFADVNSISPDVGSHPSAPPIIDGRGRLVKTHEQFRKGGIASPRALCIVRDPRDVAVSMYHYLRRRGADTTDLALDRFVRSFAEGLVLPYGAWDSHTESWLDAAEAIPGTVEIVRYEDLLADGELALSGPLANLGFDYSERRIAEALENNSADRMRVKERATDSTAFLNADHSSSSRIPFVRAASSGQWRESLPPDSAALISSRFASTIARLGYPAS